MNKSKILLATLIAALALTTLIAACGGGEPEELTFTLEIKDRALIREDATVNKWGPLSFETQRRDPVGEDTPLEAKQGDKITIELTSDELVNYHLHGYDLEGDVGPDMPVIMEFDAYATGSFPLTIHISSADGSGGGHTHDEDGDECKAELAPGEPTPQISVSASPADEPNLVEVAVETQNFELSPDGNHWHLQVNGEPVGMYANPQVTFDTRLYESSGEYEIMVSLNNAQHCDYGIQAMTTVNLDGGQSMPTDHANGSGDGGSEGQEEEIELGRLVVQPR